MSFKQSFGKSFLLIIVILILIVGGLLWFDYLGVVHVKSVFAPVYKILKKSPQTSQTYTQSDLLTANLDEDRLFKQREALSILQEELDKRESDIQAMEMKNAQVAKELSEREKNQEEREKTFNQTVKKYDDKNINVEQIANNLNGMRPEAAVANGSSSMGSYWLSLMKSERAALIQRKMISKPEALE